MIHEFEHSYNDGRRLRQEYIHNDTLEELKKSYEVETTKLQAQLDWFKRCLDYNAISRIKRCRYDIKKGDIFEVDWGVNVNAEFSNRHYGVVLRDSHITDPLVTICPLKTCKKDPHPQSDLYLAKIDGLKDAESIAVISQIRSVDKFRLYTKQVINYDMEHEVNLKMSEDIVDEILKAYKDYLSGKLITQIY